MVAGDNEVYNLRIHTLLPVNRPRIFWPNANELAVTADDPTSITKPIITDVSHPRTLTWVSTAALAMGAATKAYFFFLRCLSDKGQSPAKAALQ
jgi:hypothetical protein